MATLKTGSQGASVRRLQEQLKSAGYNPGAVDGVFGAGTARAVRQFQRARGLEADGVVGAATTRELQRRRNTDGYESTNVPAGGNRTATIESVTNRNRRNQMVAGHITVNGHSYAFRSGGHGRGSLPAGSYDVTAHLWSRSDRSMSVGGVGYSFALSDKYDSRVGGTRRLLRIHPDGGSAGTEGCIGIVGDAATQRRFREDMRAELARNGGHFTLRVG